MITFSTLSNNAAVSKNFTAIAADRSFHEWINTSDASPDCRIFVKQQLVGKNKAGTAIRRSLVSCVVQKPIAAVINGSDVTFQEQATVNLTITGPATLSTLTETDILDAVAFVKNLLSGSTVTSLRRGEV